MFCRARTYCKCKFHVIKWTDISSIISYLAFQCVFVKLPFLAEALSLLLLVSFSKSFNLFAFVSNATFISHFLLEENLCFSSFFKYILFLLKVYGILEVCSRHFSIVKAKWKVTLFEGKVSESVRAYRPYLDIFSFHILQEKSILFFNSLQK